ncbi:hypothetical protein A5630_07145 [Mycolicibacterium mucogenicum]|uniref:Uncharacterized protein n=1 Tax=Mycolicibacterium mucogenicum TaxID=56689 RepID=A0A1A3GM93_MYCMU|nr:hypothetical protein A5630_07145 [Mycolicibacterium mucogenicum]
MAAGSCRDDVLTRTTARTLACDDGTPFEDLPAPNTPRLFTFQRLAEALEPDRAVGAQRLGLFQLSGVVSEPHIGVADMTWHRQPLSASLASHVLITYFLVVLRLICLMDR